MSMCNSQINVDILVDLLIDEYIRRLNESARIGRMGGSVSGSGVSYCFKAIERLGGKISITVKGNVTKVI